ncbi:MAG TPA: hypothetical protein VGJ84_20540, partial [Polyangiaceae bacterium]
MRPVVEHRVYCRRAPDRDIFIAILPTVRAQRRGDDAEVEIQLTLVRSRVALWTTSRRTGARLY